MIALIIVAWYVLGLVGTWVTLISIDPVIRVKDVFVMFFAALLGPLTFLYVLMYAERGLLNRRVDWLSRR